MKEVLENFKDGKISLEDVLDKIKRLPYEDLDFAKIDNHRLLRKGYPETIFCPGKTISQILTILKTMMKNNHNILLTKANKEIFTAVQKTYQNAEYNKLAKTIIIQKENRIAQLC